MSYFSRLLPCFGSVVLLGALLNATWAQENSAQPSNSDKQVDPQEELRLLTLFADTFAQIKQNYVTEMSDRELMEAAIQGMVRKLDPYSNYIPPRDLDRFKTGVEAEFGGVGIIVTTENGPLEVISPMAGTPAFRAGLIAGDKILKIEGASTQGFNVSDAVKKMKGEVGTPVTLTILHPGESDPIDVTLKREKIQVPTVYGYERGEGFSWNYFIDEGEKIAYLRLSGFGRNSARELKDTMRQLEEEGVRGLILDLRFNPGGLLSAAIEISDLFVDEGRIVSTKGRNVRERKWDARRRGTYSDMPMAVLINKYSASASEIVSACLQDHDRAVVVGARSWGKGSVQNVIELEGGGSALKLTTASYHRPSGKNIHRGPDAKETDEWGVSPTDGYAVKLRGGELSQLRKWIQGSGLGRNNESQPKYRDRQMASALKYVRETLNPSAVDEVPPEPMPVAATGEHDAHPEVPPEPNLKTAK
ncbi:MAG: peptidase S41 [Blastopirellula sp.]|nr:peptidase S41 [Blastopirellula sp.]